MVQSMRSAHLSLVVAALLGGPAAGELYGQQTENGQEAEETGPTVRSVIREAVDFYQEVKTLQVNVEIAFTMESKAFEQKQETVYTVQFKRPRLYALRAKSGQTSPTIVSDGEQVFIYHPMLNQYTREDVSEGTTDSSGVEGMGAAGMAAAFLSAVPSDQLVDQLMQGVEKTEYLGVSDLDGTPCHHLRFIQDQFDAELWVQAEEHPLPRRLELDMSKTFAQSGPDDEPLANTFADAKVRMTVKFDGWKIDELIADEEFSFTPPEEAEQVDSFFDGLTENEEEPHPLLGEPAPSFTLETLDGIQVELKQHRGKVVVLDFWATWCPPCVEGLPKVSKVASELQDEGVVFYAVNVGEDAETVQEFLTKQGLDLPVLIDESAAVSEAYHADAIPQTVLVGKDGTVQVVHVGLSSDIENTLRQQLQELTKGKDLATEQLENAAEESPKSAEVEPRNLEQIWSVEKSLASVATDANGQAIYAVDAGGSCLKLNPEGIQQSVIQLDDRPSVIRAANLAGDEAAELLSFASWGRTVKAHDAEGNSLWTYAVGQGVDDVWPHDLDGDGLSEVIIGYNGSTGLHVLNNRGELLWKNTQLGNVWHVTAGDVRGSSEPEVVTTSALGMVHIFSADGDKIDDLPTSCYANMVRIAQGDPLAEPRIIVGGSADAGEVLLAMDAEGQENWKVTLAPGDGHIDSAQVAAGTPWIAVGMRGGAIHVVDVQKGAIVASYPGQGNTPRVSWLHVDSETSPLLLVATGRQLTAFRVLDRAAEETPSDDDA